MTLSESIKQSLQQQAKPTIGTEQKQTENVLRAKLGRAVSSKGPRASELGAQAAVNLTQAGAAQQAQEGLMASQQLAQQEALLSQQKKQEQQQLAQQQKETQSQIQGRKEELFQDFNQGKVDLQTQEGKAKAEQLGFLTRLSADKYVNQLQTEGAKSRLDQGLNFEEELTKSIFGDQMDMLKDSYDFKTLYNMNQRDFDKEMKAMSLENAIRVAKQEAKAEGKRKMWEGLTSGGTAVLSSFAAPRGKS